MQIDVSIIIVSYNTCQLTLDCIESIVKETKGVSYEIMLIDNASSDKTVSEVKIRFPNVQLILNKENLGYSRANNQGIKKATGKAILLLNSDTKIKENAIYKAYQNLEFSDILTVKIKGVDGKNQQAAGFGPNLLNVFFWAFFIDDLPLLKKIIKPYQISDVGFFDVDHSVDWVIGAFFMMKRKVIEKTGFLDENIFMYGEEMEYCRRAKKIGFKVKYFANPAIIHYGMASAESDEGAVVGEYKALKYFFQKHGGSIQTMTVALIIKMSIILRVLIFTLFAPQKAKIYVKAFKLS